MWCRVVQGKNMWESWNVTWGAFAYFFLTELQSELNCTRAKTFDGHKSKWTVLKQWKSLLLKLEKK